MALAYIPAFITRIDAAPLDDDEFSFSFNSWISNLIDTLNFSIETIQDNLNGINTGLVPGSFTTAQITQMATPPSVPPNGVIWYCTDASPPCLVSWVNGALVKLSTTAFP